MEPAPLPPPLVNLLNDLAHGAEIEESLPEARRWVDGALEALEAEAEVTLSEADDAACANALYLLRQIREDLAHLGERTPPVLAARAAELAGLLRAIVRDRNRSWFTELAPVDRLIVAAMAVLKGRGHGGVVRERVPPALATLKALHEDFLLRAPGLPDDVRSALGRGYDLLLQGTEDLRQFVETGRMPPLEDALTRLRAGSRLVEVQARWRSPVTVLPEGGEELSRLVRSAVEGREDWRSQRERFRADGLPRLAHACRRSAERLLLPLAVRDGVLAGVEGALEGLERAVGSTDAQPMDLAAAATRLELAVSVAAEAAMQPDRALGTRWQDVVQAVAGAWNGTVTDMVLIGAAGWSLPKGHPAAVCVQAYLDTGDRLHLLPAMEILLAAAGAEQAALLKEEEGPGLDLS